MEEHKNIYKSEHQKKFYKVINEINNIFYEIYLSPSKYPAGAPKPFPDIYKSYRRVHKDY